MLRIELPLGSYKLDEYCIDFNLKRLYPIFPDKYVGSHVMDFLWPKSQLAVLTMSLPRKMESDQ
jgi:hypothetical protein